MTKFLTLLVFLLGSAASFAQVFDVETIRDNGNPSQRINLVFLADGYTESELPEFIADTKKIANSIFSQSPFKEYKNYFNVYAIKVISAESGASHPQNTADYMCADTPYADVDNYFGSTFDSYGIHRLLVPTRYDLIYNVLAVNFPMYDQVFVIVNSPYYGGSGGDFATVSTDEFSTETGIHETGHSFADLADEYWAGPTYAYERINRTQDSNPQTNRWKNWIGDNMIDIYPYEEAPTWFRPHQNCKMRYLGSPFCSVCKEAIVETIHSFIEPLLAHDPLNDVVQMHETSMQFSVVVDKPATDNMSITWTGNGNIITSGQDEESILLSVNSLNFGANTLKAIVTDATSLSRSDAHAAAHTYEVEWSVYPDPILGIEGSSPVLEYDIRVFPNPIEKQLNVSYTLEKQSAVIIELNDVTGRTVKKLVDEIQSGGKHSISFQADAIQMKTGFYYLTLKIDEAKIMQKLIRE